VDRQHAAMLIDEVAIVGLVGGAVGIASFAYGALGSLESASLRWAVSLVVGILGFVGGFTVAAQQEPFLRREGAGFALFATTAFLVAAIGGIVFARACYERE